MSTATKNRKTSPSDLTARKPVSEAASASVSGAYGMGVAALFIKQMEEQGDAHAKQVNVFAKSNKDKIRDLLKCSADDHVAFVAALNLRLEQIKAEATKAGIGVSEYREANPKDDYVYVSCYVWKLLSNAINAGWKPDTENNAWHLLKKQASDYLNNAKQAKEQQTIKAEIAKTKAAANMAPELKAATVKVLEAKLEAAAIKGKGTSTEGGKGSTTPPVKDLITQVQKLIEGRPIQDVEKLFVWLASYLTDKSPSSARVVNTELHRVNEATKAKQGAPAAVEPAANDADREEKAQAHSGRVIATPPARKAKAKSRK